MRKTLEQIEEVVKTLNIGDVISVLTPNGTGHYDAARFYERKGIFNGVETNKDGKKDLVLLVGKNSRKFRFRLARDYDLVNGERVYTDYCWDILDICK